MRFNLAGLPIQTLVSDPIFGNGALGTVVIAANDPAFVGGDYDELTINAAVVVTSPANRMVVIRARSKVTLVGGAPGAKIDCNGVVGAAAQIGVGSNVQSGGGGGGGGGDAAVNPGTPGLTPSPPGGGGFFATPGTPGTSGAGGVNGAPGGVGGNGTAGTPGTADPQLARVLELLHNTAVFQGGLPGAGGVDGADGGTGGNDGGGAAAFGPKGLAGLGGNGGGVCIIIAPEIDVQAGAVIECKGNAGGAATAGGAGANGTVPNGGGGGGGGGGSGGQGGCGGFCLLFGYEVKTAGATLTATGGAGGAPGLGGAGGTGAGLGANGGNGGNGASGPAGSDGLVVAALL